MYSFPFLSTIAIETVVYTGFIREAEALEFCNEEWIALALAFVVISIFSDGEDMERPYMEHMPGRLPYTGRLLFPES